MSENSIEIVIERPPQAVFAVLSDVTKNASWASASVSGRQTSPGPVGVGTTAHEVSRFMGRRLEVDSEIVEFRADQLLRYVTRGGPFPFQGTFTVEPVANGTRLTTSFQIRPPGFRRVVGPLIRILAKRQFERDLANLKRLMEAGSL